MKKLLLTLLLPLLFLAGCESIDRAIKGDDYVDAKIAKEKAAAKLAKLNKASFPQLSSKVGQNEAQVKIVTSKGDITLKLFPKYAPLAVENFLTHAKEGYYDGLTFHRVISDFMIQSGDPSGDGTGGQSIWKDKDKSKDSGNGFKNETSDYLYNIRGALAMANAGQDTNGSQFYIVQNGQDQSSQLSTEIYPKKIIKAYQKGGYPAGDGKYTVFGQVTKGMEVVDRIAQVETDDNDKPKEKVTIKKIDILKDYQFKK